MTELCNRSTTTQSPTRSLKSHVWSSSSVNNCHAVHRSLSSGASVYECTMGIFFTSYHFVSQFPPTRFPLITAIRMCHLLPVHHLGMAFLAGSKAKIQHVEEAKQCQKAPVNQDTQSMDNKVFWTDESKFKIFGLNRRVYVWQRVGQGAANPWITSIIKHRGGSIMVCVCLCRGLLSIAKSENCIRWKAN